MNETTLLLVARRLGTCPAVGAGVHSIPEGEADARSGGRHLRHRMLPGPLRPSAGDEQVAAPQVEVPRLPAALRPQQELARLAERNQGDGGLLDLLEDLVAVPRHAVLPVAVEVEADG